MPLSARAYFLVLACALCLLTFTGCRTPAALITLPAVAYTTPDQAIDLLTARRDAVRTVQAQADLILTPARGQPQSLSAQLVHDAPDRVRMRASKLNHNVMDLTVTDEAAWIAVSSRVTDEAPDAEAGLARLAEALPFLVRGPDYRRANAAGKPSGGQLTLIWNDNLSARLDAATLTPLRFTLTDPQKPHDAPVVIEPVYTLYNGTAWLRSAVATGGFGRIALTFFDVELNAKLNPRAFKPPRRATRHPR